jgi:hypothetical protein
MKNTTTSSRRTKKTTPTTPTKTAVGVAPAQVEEMVDEMLRRAFREHSRTMEQHLKSIHERLVALERKGGQR